MRRAAQRVRDAFIASVAAIERRADLDQAWAEATELDATVRELGADVTALRSRLARKIATRDQLKLAPLAERLSVSTSRAQQLMHGGTRAALRAKRAEGSTDA